MTYGHAVRFAVHSLAVVRKKAPRAATACPAAVPYLVLHDARLALADLSRLPRRIENLLENTPCTLIMAVGQTRKNGLSSSRLRCLV